jgi:hypothetical protein
MTVTVYTHFQPESYTYLTIQIFNSKAPDGDGPCLARFPSLRDADLSQFK